LFVFAPVTDSVPFELKVIIETPSLVMKLFPLISAVVNTLLPDEVNGINVNASVVPLAYAMLPVQPLVTLPLSVIVAVPLLVPYITNCPDEFTVHVWLLVLKPTLERVPFALNVTNPPSVLKLFALNILFETCVVGIGVTFPFDVTGVNVNVSVVPLAYAMLPAQPLVALPLRVIMAVPLLVPNITNWPAEFTVHV
jgi:hypothetical protein